MLLFRRLGFSLFSLLLALLVARPVYSVSESQSLPPLNLPSDPYVAYQTEMITPELQMYKCFGCTEHGDVFTFLEEHEGMEFSEALKYLAEKVGVKLKPSKFDEGGEKEKLFAFSAPVLNLFCSAHSIRTPHIIYPLVLLPITTFSTFNLIFHNQFFEK